MYAIATVDRLKLAGSILFAFLLFAVVLSGPAFSQESFGFTEHAILYDTLAHHGMPGCYWELYLYSFRYTSPRT